MHKVITPPLMGGWWSCLLPRQSVRATGPFEAGASRDQASPSICEMRIYGTRASVALSESVDKPPAQSVLGRSGDVTLFLSGLLGDMSLLARSR